MSAVAPSFSIWDGLQGKQKALDAEIGGLREVLVDHVLM